MAAIARTRQLNSTGALVSLSLTMLLASLGTSIANVGLPTIAGALDATFQQAQWIVLAYLLAITTVIVTVGKLGDLIGRRRLMLFGIALFTASSIACGGAPVLSVLVAARAVQGVGAAILMALSMALVGQAVANERMGRAMGLLGTMSAVGTALGPTLGGLVIAASDWRWMFFLNLPLGVVSFFLAYYFLPRDSKTASARDVTFDKLGTLLLAVTLVAYALAMTLGHGQFGQRNAALLLMAAIGLGTFLWVEMKAESPLIRLAILRNPLLSGGFAMSTLVTTVAMSTLVVGPFYLSVALGLSPTQVGLAMSVGPVVAALTGVPAGRLVDRHGPQGVTLAGLTSTFMGCVLLSLAPASLGIVSYIFPLALITSGYAVFQAANNTGVMASATADQRGLVSGMLNLSRNLGLISGASVMGAVFAISSKASDVTAAAPAAVEAGMHTTFATAAALVMAAFPIALMCYRGRSPKLGRCSLVAKAGGAGG